MDALTSCLTRLHRRLGGPMVFGGLAEVDDVPVQQTVGARTKGLDGVVVKSHSGLGGRVVVEHRPRSVANYRTARNITHEYDREILGEGIVSLLAVPAIVLGQVRALVYVGSRDSSRMGDFVVTEAMRETEQLAGEVRVRDEVERRLAHLDVVDPDPASREAVREIWAELRVIADTTADAETARTLRDLEMRLSPAPNGTRVLSRREVDVLSLVGLGCGNREIAERLGLGVETVRSYLRNAMRKLDAHTRMEAVAAARRQREVL